MTREQYFGAVAIWPTTARAARREGRVYIVADAGEVTPMLPPAGRTWTWAAGTWDAVAVLEALFARLGVADGGLSGSLIADPEIARRFHAEVWYLDSWELLGWVARRRLCSRCQQPDPYIADELCSYCRLADTPLAPAADEPQGE